MTRHDARMIAEELHAIQLKENPYYGDELLDVPALAERLSLSVSFVRHNCKFYPRLRVGGVWRYPFNQVIKYLSEL